MKALGSFFNHFRQKQICPECGEVIGHTDKKEIVFDCKLCHICGEAYAGNMCHYCHFDKEIVVKKRWQEIEETIEEPRSSIRNLWD